jgi:hypothetical protein
MSELSPAKPARCAVLPQLRFAARPGASRKPQTTQPANQQNQQANHQWNPPNYGGQQAGQNFAQPPQANQGGGASQRAIVALVLTIAGLFFAADL